MKSRKMLVTPWTQNRIPPPTSSVGDTTLASSNTVYLSLIELTEIT